MLRILKIGGSVLTDKTTEGSAKLGEIERIAEEVSASPGDLILVHGAGSFGHIHAQRFGLPSRFDPIGLLETHRSVVSLNSLFVSALSKRDLFPLPVHPLSSVLLDRGRIASMDPSIVLEMVKRGILPVLHGDVALDRSLGSGIVSGDQLVSYLARELRSDLVILGTAADGVMSRGRVLDRIAADDLSMIEEELGAGPGFDVTGGMRGKVGELLDLAQYGVTSRIFNATVEGNVEAALRGQAIGTAVVP
ncbi:MAG: isopentenyl phosphate kinase family protein [Methanotrichaceae archaeon]|nr:isopentenyl phosphate kinase family protein [Methanotrichaceae archaeon]